MPRSCAALLLLLTACATAGRAPATVHRLAFETKETDECSVSILHHGARGTLTLALGADGRAELRYSSDADDVYMDQQTARSQHHALHNEARWRGRTTAKDGEQVVQLRLIAQRCSLVPAAGPRSDPPYPCDDLRGTRGRLTLRCRPGVVTVQRNINWRAVPPSEHTALRCSIVDPDLKTDPTSTTWRAPLPYPLTHLTNDGALGFPETTTLVYSWNRDNDQETVEFLAPP
jgi:hypothetical protein